MRSRAGYWIGGALVLAGVVGAIAWFIGSFMRLGNEVDDFPRVSIPGEATVQLEARKYVVYYEGPNADEFVPPVEIAIADAQTGVPLTIARYGGSLTYSLSGHEGSAQVTVTPARAGPHVVRANSAVAPSGASVAFGRSLAWSILRMILVTLAIGGLLFAAGVTLLIVTGVRRSRAGRVFQAPPPPVPS